MKALLAVLALAAGLAARASQPPDVDAAWAALKKGDLAAARSGFAAALAAPAVMVEGRTGLGYTALREGNTQEAARWFSVALEADPDRRDALVGLALVEEKLKDWATARQRVERVLELDPDDGEARSVWERLTARLEEGSELSREAHLEPPARDGSELRLAARTEGVLVAVAHGAGDAEAGRQPRALDVPMRVNRRHFELRQDDGSYRPVFLKAIDLGVALPGRFPSEFPQDPPLYRRWFADMKAAGFQAIRVYTILPPAFYDVLAEYNKAHARDPLYLIHGVWVELPEDDNFSDPAFIEGYRAEVRRVVDLAHGALDLPRKPGHAGGRYRSDVSPWWIATIMGREWEPYSVITFDRANPGTSDFQGGYVVAKGVTASERWQAEQTDYMIGYETERWGAQRPVAWTNWPTLDPLHHPTETSAREEREWQKKLGLFERKETSRDYDDDAVAMDMEKFEATAANLGGLFTSYHVYPYYPDFMALDPGYRAAVDPQGRPNAYWGYLKDLLAYHRKHPVFIAEFGVPTSRDVAHVHPQGWTHGALGERRQGEILADMLQNIHDAGAAGGAMFEWIDEWFKHTWSTRPVHLPAERNPLWHDRQCPEQNFGLLAYRPGLRGRGIVVDGKGEDWEGIAPLLSSPHGEEAELRSLAMAADATDLYVLVRTRRQSPLAYVLALDTVDPQQGDPLFPAGLKLRSAAGLEAALVFDATRAQVVISESYDRLTQRLEGVTRPARGESGKYVVPWIMSNRERVTRAGQVVPEVRVEAGRLRRGTMDRRDPAFDGLADWAHDPESGVYEFRLPWGLLNVTDPSSRNVLFESPEYPDKHRETDGLRVALAAFEPEAGEPLRAKEGRALDVLPAAGPEGQVAELPLFTWPTWNQPTYHSYPKQSLDIVREALRRIPATPLGEPGPDVTAELR